MPASSQENSWANAWERIGPDEHESFETKIATDAALRGGDFVSDELLKRAYNESLEAARQDALRSLAGELAILNTQPGSRILLEYARGETSQDIREIMQPAKPYDETSSPIDRSPPRPHHQAHTISWPQKVHEERSAWQDVVISAREWIERHSSEVLLKVALLRKR